MRIRQLLRLLGATIMLATGLAVQATPADALPLTITVTIDQVGECCGGNIDNGSGADFYSRIWIDGVATDFGVFADNEDMIRPNWVATGVVDHTRDYIPVTIEIFDEDSGLNFRDNQIDVSTGPHGNTRAVDLFVSLRSIDSDCNISGDAYGKCNQVIRTFGNEDEDVGDVFFRIGVSEPPQAPGLHVGCLHSPLWPQPGNPVTITASSFGDQPDGQALPPKLADKIEVWFSTDGGATRQIVGNTGRQTTFTSTRTAGGGGTTLSYGCRVVDDGIPIFSGWHSVQVGNPPAGQAVPVFLSGDRERALDILLIPATQNVRRAPFNPGDTALLTFPTYTGAADPNFLAHAQSAFNELMREQVVLDNQRSVNLWLARDGGATGGTRDLRLDADGDGERDDVAPDTNGDGVPDGDGITDTCQHVPPANLATAYGFANVRALMHPATPPPGNVDTLRECARNGVFSAEATEAGVFIHETGHAGFGLADEYCCDGGYFQTKDVPNTYLSLKACQDDVESLGGVDSDCRGMDSVDDDTDLDFWVSDPGGNPTATPPVPPNDLMNDNAFARRADRRRITFVFGLAAQGKL